MALPNEIHPFAIAGGGNQYQVANSLRFRASNSAFLSRTPASASNRKTWTWSGWVKRGSLAAGTLFMGGASQSDTGGTDIAFYNDLLYVQGYNTNWIVTTQVFRDPSAWYHIVIAFDTTQATASNRLKLYVNGSQVTTFSTDNRSSLTLNGDYGINQAALHRIGYQSVTFGLSYLDGYLAEVNFIDGYAYDSSYFGQNDPITNQWIPKKYTGTYGINGFYLPFNNTSSTTALGFDYNPSPTVTSTVSGSNSITLSNAASKWGSVSLSLGSQSNKYISTTHNTNQYIYNTNFTIEFWYKGQASDTNFSTSQDGGILSGYNYLVSKGRTNSAAYGWGIRLYTGGVLGLNEYYGTGSAGVYTTGVNVLDNNWHHICYMRSGSTSYIFVDGTLYGSGTLNNNTNNSFNLLINGMFDYNTGSYPTYFCGGYIDDLRFYSGLVKYSTSGFTAPTAALGIGQLADPYWNYNILAYPFEGSNGATSFDLYAANAWTPSGISVTSGTTYDVMIDSPTAYDDGGNNRGNYCTFNPTATSSRVTLSNGSLTATKDAFADWNTTLSTYMVSSGKWYYEFVLGTTTNKYFIIGYVKPDFSWWGVSQYPGVNSGSYGLDCNTGNKRTGDVSSSYGSGFVSNDIVQVALDLDNGRIWWGKNGTWFASGDPAAGTNAAYTSITGSLIPALGMYTSETGSINFGQRPFSYTPPAGFKALNTYNLPNPSLPLV